MRIKIIVPYTFALAISLPTVAQQLWKFSEVPRNQFKFLFIFGDSYTNVGFDPNGDQPTPSNPFGNSNMNGDSMLTGGDNWVVNLVKHYNSTALLAYNFAFNCAVVDKDVVDNTVLCPFAKDHQIVNQVQQFKELLQKRNARSAYGNFTDGDSLFILWIGINDAHQSSDNSGVMNIMEKDVVRLFDQVQTLYELGGRHFLVLNIPPYERSPQIRGNDTKVRIERVAYEHFNSRLAQRVEEFQKAREDASTTLFDTIPAFTEALDDPSKIGMKDATCAGGPADQGCIWEDDFHPGPELHQWLAQRVANHSSVEFFNHAI